MPACALCGREEQTTRHHLFPRSVHRRLKRKGKAAEPLQEESSGASAMDTVDLCPPCHRRVHQLFTEKELARCFSSLEQLRAHEQVRRWLLWISGKPSGFRPRMGGGRRRH